MKKTIILSVAACLFAARPFAQEPVTPASLWQDFVAAPDAFRDNHRGKRITFAGVVADTHISIYLTPVVSLVDAEGEASRLICVLPRADTAKLTDFTKGQKATMQGDFYAARDDDKIVIKQCRAIRIGSSD